MYQSHAPLAIVGMAFRLPGDISDEERLWSLLVGRGSVVGAIGEERWDTERLSHPSRGEPGRSVTFAAGTLLRIEEFDAGFFGISPREARLMDPQQRLMLELAWEALENAGQVPAALAGSDCGVYVGASSAEFLLRAVDDPSGVDGHTMTGALPSIVANRVSYLLDLRGPSMVVDTACSSSLVALDQACHALWRGEVSCALVGGVNVLVHPLPFIGFSKASMLSAGGRCRTFDARGDGYVRSEGGLVLFLKPLEKAVEAGDPIQAVIRSTGVNSDGRNEGMTLPRLEGQTALLRKTIGRAGVDSSRIVYVEAHGTGTAAGDPVETAALGEVLGVGRNGSPLLIGSIKTNIGHLEPASGLAGLVKTVLGLKRGVIPPTLLADGVDPKLDLEGRGLRVVTEPTPLPDTGGPALAGVSSFGFGGTNAHVILEAFRKDEPAVPVPAALPPLILSARSRSALFEMARRYGERIDGSDREAYYRVAYGAAFRRQALEEGAVVLGGDPEEVRERLIALAAGESVSGLVQDVRMGRDVPVAFVYSGNGAQWAGMGRSLLASEGVFLEAVREVDALVGARADLSILAELARDPGEDRLHLTEVAQPALFAVQVGITTVLRELGVEPQMVVGHSVGEIAAAWASGCLTLSQAVEVIVERSAAQGRTAGAGRMAAVGLPASDLLEIVETSGLQVGVELAGVNSPRDVTVSGSPDALGELERLVTARGAFFRNLDLNYAFHSRSMDGEEGALRERLANVRGSDGTIPFVSTVTGREMVGSGLDGAYWWDNIRRPVLFHQAIDRMAERGTRIFLEIGPHAIMQRYLATCLDEKGVQGRVLPTLLRDDDRPDRLTEVAGHLHLLGARVDLGRHFPVRAPHTQLPNYPWQRERHWPEASVEAEGVLGRRRVHPLLGWPCDRERASWENHLDVRLQPWLADHRVGGSILFPATGFVEMALAASIQTHPDAGSHEIEGLEIRVPLTLDDGHARTVRLELDPEDGTFRIRGRERLSTGAWVTHAIGRVTAAAEPLTPLPSGAPAQGYVGGEELLADATRHYALTEGLGFGYGHAFQGLREVRSVGEGAAGVLLQWPEGLPRDPRILLHPALVDASLQAVLHLVLREGAEAAGAALVPVRVDRVTLLRRGGEPRRARLTVTGKGARSLTIDVDVYAEGGELVGRIEGCRLRAAPIDRSRPTDSAVWTWATELRPRPTSALPPAPGSREFAEGVERVHATRAPERRRARHAEVLPLLDALAGLFAYEALAGFTGPDGVLRPFPATVETAPVFSWLMRVLLEDGFLEETDGIKRVVPPSESTPTAAHLWTAILGDHPEYMPDLVALGRIGRSLPSILRGDVTHEECVGRLLGEGLWGRYSAASPTVVDLRETVALGVVSWLQEWPRERRLRVLEIGGDSLFPSLVKALPPGAFDFTHVADEPGSRDVPSHQDEMVPGLRVLPAVPGSWIPPEALGDAGYDLVLLSPSGPGGADVSVRAAGLRSVLRAGGVVVVLERASDRWTELVRGDASARRGAFSPDRAVQVLREAGFEEVAVVTEPEASDSSLGAYALFASAPHAAVDRAQAPSVPPARWLVLHEGAGASSGNGSGPVAVGSQLARRLREAGHEVAEAVAGDRFEHRGEGRYAFDPADPASARALVGALRDEAGAPGHVVHAFDPRHADPSVDGPGDPLEAIARPVLALQHIVGALEDASSGEAGASPRLWVMTHGAATWAEPHHVLPSAPGAAALWGFGRVVMNEYPELQCTLIDLQDDAPSGVLVGRVMEELLDPDGEDEIILGREGRRLVARLRSVSRSEAVGPDGEGARLHLARPGQLRNLRWREDTPVAPGDGEVEIETRAVGLNFRDIMYALGVLPEEALEGGFAGARLGLEVAGVIRRVGAAVDGLRPGDEVLAFTSGGFARHVVTPATAVARKPAGWSFAAAATVPTAFLTAWYALKHLARVRAGERVLIHGAAGGVGLAAIQVARHLGAEVFATAGTVEKREVVRLLGVRHVSDSRSLEFEREFLEATDGQGVDVVLNSLAGEAARKSLGLLRPFGRFLELGKRDFYENTRLGLRPFKDNITLHGIDADQLILGRPALAREMLDEVMALMKRGVLRPLPHRSFKASEALDAFRYMQQSRQIGKVVVEFDETASVDARRPARQKATRFRPDATYLVAGGVGGLGLRTARWMAERGAGHLILVSRRGSASPGVEAAIELIEAAGARAHVRACDIEDRDAVSRVVRECGACLPPLAGVVHSAMVLDDGAIRNLTPDRTSRVMAPKVRGAWNLHMETRKLPLDHFILFSSATTPIGHPGQAHYVAGNMYMEALAAVRRAEGLPATCVGWGAIRDAGYFTRNEGLLEVLSARTGAQGMTADKVLEDLEWILSEFEADCAVADFDWTLLDRALPAARSARFSAMTRRTAEGDEAGEPDLRRRLADADPERVREMLTDLVTREISNVLRLPPERIRLDGSLQEMGMDSLTGMELVAALESRLEVRLPAMALSQRSVHRIVDLLHRSLRLDGEDHGGMGSETVLGESVEDVVRMHGGHVGVGAAPGPPTRRIGRSVGASGGGG